MTPHRLLPCRRPTRFLALLAAVACGRAGDGASSGAGGSAMPGVGGGSGDGGSGGGSAGAHGGAASGGAPGTGGVAGGAVDAGAGGNRSTGGAAGDAASGGGPGTGGAAGDGLGGVRGTGGMGGAGSGGFGVGGTSGAGGTGDCIDLSHLGARWRGGRDLRVIGTGFGAAEGQTVRLVITYGEPRSEPSYGLAETAIRSGSFEIVLPKAVENYTGMGVYIDKAKDNACTPGDDPLWQMTTGADSGTVTWEITPNLVHGALDPRCTINGIFDLTKPLPCPGEGG